VRPGEHRRLAAELHPIGLETVTAQIVTWGACAHGQAAAGEWNGREKKKFSRAVASFSGVLCSKVAVKPPRQASRRRIAGQTMTSP